jgi:hypothetical protein
MQKLGYGLAVAAILAVAQPAFAAGTSTLDTVSLKDITSALQNQGFKAQSKTDKNGDYIESASGGQAFYVYLANCDSGTNNNCKTVVFESGGWTKNNITQDAVNAWVDKNSKGWAVVYQAQDDKRWYLNYRASIVGGVTNGWLEDTSNQFATEMQYFNDFMKASS